MGITPDSGIGRDMNRESYDAIAVQWEQVRVRMSDAEQRILELLCGDLRFGCTVLDLGCGTGRPIAEYLVSQGFSVTGVDQSVQMLGFARQRLPTQEWILANLDTFVPGQSFSAVIAWDSLFHVSRVLYGSIFRNVKMALQPGGRFALTVGGSEHPPFTDTMFDREFFYDSHSPEVALQLLRDTGFELVHSEFLNLPTSGRDKGRFAMVARAA
ncbi:MAG: class I SAM-dependent methyltransferase [Nitrosomonas sp.]|nr:class I SAM-dependent methyltransferase [Nitrosomonas sp.]MCW5606452.1 class I SAM-dependent methyltransferase [Nitrosomonas sp.]